jgi:hypothetical protein
MIILVLIVFFIGFVIISNWKKEVQIDSKTGKTSEISYYEKYCWHCGKKEVIDSRYNSKCPKCNKYYLCNTCGKCLCDKKNYRNNSSFKIKSEWIESGRNSFNHTYGHCQKCGKKLSGDRSKKLCYSCWTANNNRSRYKRR